MATAPPPVQPATTLPFIKWVGGKRGLLKQYLPLFPERIEHYWEPMVGGGAVLFRLRDRVKGTIAIGDVNPDLISAYLALRDYPGALEVELRASAALHGEECYLATRGQDPESLDPVARAGRFIYLAKAGFNGLWRVNNQGKHNVPIGRDSAGRLHPGKSLFDWDNLRLVSRALQGVVIRYQSYRDPGWQATIEHPERTLAYLDPPYCPLDDEFTRYQREAFGPDEHVALAGVLTLWHERGMKIFLSNSDVPLVRELYDRAPWNLTPIVGRRSVGAGTGGQGNAQELVIRNYA